MGLLTTKDAADKLGVTVQRIHALIKDERLPAQRLGRDYVINEDDLALVADRKPGRPKKAEGEGEPGSIEEAIAMAEPMVSGTAYTPASKAKPAKGKKANGAAKGKPAKKRAAKKKRS